MISSCLVVKCMIREKYISVYEKIYKKVFDCTQSAGLGLRRKCMEFKTLRELCGIVGVSRRIIQGYENAGLMKPTNKNKFGHLLYDEKALHRAMFVRFLQRLGFKLKEIKELIDAPNDVMKEALVERIGKLEGEKAELDQIIRKARIYVENLE